VRYGVPAAGLVDVKANHLLADRALRDQGMKPPPAEKLEEFQTPYDQVPHSRRLAFHSLHHAIGTLLRQQRCLSPPD
jgi:hypothetical protein